MKLVNKYFDKNRAGHVTLRPEDDEDMWHLYNLIQEVGPKEVASISLLSISPSPCLGG